MCRSLLAPLTFALTSLIEGGTCPAPGDVAARARAILHWGAEQPLTEGFIVERREAGLHVELRRSDGVIIGERLLPDGGSCDELAQAAAVTLSAWLSDVHPDFAAELPAAPAPSVGAPEPPGPARLPPEPAEPVVVPRVPPPRVESSSLREARPLLSWELDGGVGAGLADGEWAAGGSLAAAFVPPRRGWGARVGIVVDTSRSAPLGSGSVRWRRWPLWWGPSWRFDLDGLALDVTSGPALAWLRVAGADLEGAKAQSGLTWAWTLDARLASRGGWGWFVGASGYAYLGQSTAYASASEFALPRFAVSALVGARVLP